MSGPAPLTAHPYGDHLWAVSPLDERYEVCTRSKCKATRRSPDHIPPPKPIAAQETSREAYHRRDGTNYQRVLTYIASTGERGTTTDEAEVALGMIHQTCSAAFNSLMRDRRIEDSGRKRKTRTGRDAIVWTVRP